jgi:hypothetical protein
MYCHFIYITLCNTSGVVTVGYQAVQNGSEVIATEKYGNSDTSAESRANVLPLGLSFNAHWSPVFVAITSFASPFGAT